MSSVAHLHSNNHQAPLVCKKIAPDIVGLIAITVFVVTMLGFIYSAAPHSSIAYLALTFQLLNGVSIFVCILDLVWMAFFEDKEEGPPPPPLAGSERSKEPKITLSTISQEQHIASSSVHQEEAVSPKQSSTLLDSSDSPEDDAGHLATAATLFIEPQELQQALTASSSSDHQEEAVSPQQSFISLDASALTLHQDAIDPFDKDEALFAKPSEQQQATPASSQHQQIVKFEHPSTPESALMASTFSRDLLLRIFSYLNAHSLFCAFRVNKHWNTMAIDATAFSGALFPNITVFDVSDWKKYCTLSDYNLDVSDLPAFDLHKNGLALRKFTSKYSVLNNAGFTLLTIPRGLTIPILGQIVKKAVPDAPLSFSYASTVAKERVATVVNSKTLRVLVSNHSLEDQSYVKQKVITMVNSKPTLLVSNHSPKDPSYDFLTPSPSNPTVLEFATLIATNYMRSRTCLYSTVKPVYYKCRSIKINNKTMYTRFSWDTDQERSLCINSAHLPCMVDPQKGASLRFNEASIAQTQEES